MLRCSSLPFTSKCSLFVAAIGLGLSLNASAVTFATTSVYDSTSNANAVDFNANGNALGGTAATDVAGFTANVSSAFGAGLGGVVDFGTDTAPFDIFVGATANSGFAASYASGAKSISVTANRGVRVAAYGSATPISGVNGFDMLDVQDGTQTLVLTLGPVVGGLPGEAITTVGLTANSRNSNASTVSMSVAYSDSSTATLSRALAGTAVTDDTFYGFVAPAGLSISSMTITRSARVPFDDFGFITSVVPEPSSAGFLGLGLVGMLRRRR